MIKVEIDIKDGQTEQLDLNWENSTVAISLNPNSHITQLISRLKRYPQQSKKLI